jgi:hypothetical protein
VVVGDVNAGRAYFEAKCAGCHSATCDVRGIASRITSPMQLQNAWPAVSRGENLSRKAALERDSWLPRVACCSPATAAAISSALDSRDGKPLWHTRIGNGSNAPETYLVDGKQHVLFAVGDTLYAFTLY